MQSLLGYSKWENFIKVIDKAKDACKNAGEDIQNHFPDVRKMVSIGSDSEREIDCITKSNHLSHALFLCLPQSFSIAVTKSKMISIGATMWAMSSLR